MARFRVVAGAEQCLQLFKAHPERPGQVWPLPGLGFAFARLPADDRGAVNAELFSERFLCQANNSAPLTQANPFHANAFPVHGGNLPGQGVRGKVLHVDAACWLCSMQTLLARVVGDAEMGCHKGIRSGASRGFLTRPDCFGGHEGKCHRPEAVFARSMARIPRREGEVPAGGTALGQKPGPCMTPWSARLGTARQELQGLSAATDWG